MLTKINLYCSLLEALSRGKIKILKVSVREKRFLFLQRDTKNSQTQKLKLYLTVQAHLLSHYADLVASVSDICCIFSCSTCLATESQCRQMLGMSASIQQITLNMAMGIYGNKNISIKFIMGKSCSVLVFSMHLCCAVKSRGYHSKPIYSFTLQSTLTSFALR